MSHQSPTDDFMSDLRRFFLDDLITKAQQQLAVFLANGDEKISEDVIHNSISNFVGSAADAEANDFVLLPKYLSEGIRRSKTEGEYRYKMFLQGLVEFTTSIRSELVEDSEIYQKVMSQNIKPHRALKVFRNGTFRFILPEGDVSLASEKMKFHSYPLKSEALNGFLISDEFIVPVVQWSALDLPFHENKNENFIIISFQDQSIALGIDSSVTESVSVSQEIIEESNKSSLVEFTVGPDHYWSINIDLCLAAQLDKLKVLKLKQSGAVEASHSRKQAA